MPNCHEGISSYLGDRLAELASRPEYLPIAPAVRVWRKALEMPPGCSAIELDRVLAVETTKELFVEALTEIHSKLKEHRSRDQVRQIIDFLTLVEHAPEKPFEPDRI